jgi:GH15 family glucan-1,4-alpha-glucosidase
MALRIEDYSLIGDGHTAALVGRDGSIDWLCLPRFDSGACFAALLGTAENGRWLLAPQEKPRRIQRHYREGTLVLETDFETESGLVTLIDFMPLHNRRHDVIRIVAGRRGQVKMRMDLTIRFDYGSIVPWVRHTKEGIWAIAGPEQLHLRTPVPLEGHNFHTLSEFTVSAGQRIPFSLTWSPSHEPRPSELVEDPEACLAVTEGWWRDWSGRCSYRGYWRDAVVRSLITLKALIYAPTGGMVAAPTTSLPEWIGGVRNWDYRYCWLRDATFTLYALMAGGYIEEARNWREWLVRAVAGKPSQIQILYGLAGERRTTEMELPWLRGYENSAPVRIGNLASHQHQLDVYGEVMDALHFARRTGLEPDENAWRVQRALLDFLESVWEMPDEGIWEVRGPRRNFTHSKVMAWVAMDRAVKDHELFGLDGPVENWRQLRAVIHDQVCREGFNADLNSFAQYYGGKTLDASLLVMPLVGFLPPTDPRIIGTIQAIEKNLVRDGFVERYLTDQEIDGLPTGEGTFLICTFWLADNLALQGRQAEAKEIFERLLALRNETGLLAEQYDPITGRMLGNFPQGFSHLALVNTARNLSEAGGPAEDRSQEEEPAQMG